MGLLDRVVGGCRRGGVTHGSGAARFRDAVEERDGDAGRDVGGDAGGDTGGEDGHALDSHVAVADGLFAPRVDGDRGCICFSSTANGLRSFTMLPSSR